jgi:hypothetical protein
MEVLLHGRRSMAVITKKTIFQVSSLKLILGKCLFADGSASTLLIFFRLSCKSDTRYDRRVYLGRNQRHAKTVLSSSFLAVNPRSLYSEYLFM